MEEYTYRTLSSCRHSRVVVLHAATDHDADLDCNLAEINLDQSDGMAQQYDALSYVWGSAIGSAKLICEERLIRITPNCEKALRHLRRPDEAITLWVDAICIDQSNLDERAQQVMNMGLIYKNAGRVIIWLGEGSSAVSRCFSRVSSMLEQGQALTISSYDPSNSLVGELSVSDCLNVWRNPWSSRIWTVQEFSYAAEPVVMYGDSMISWDSYRDLAMAAIGHVAYLDEQSVSQFKAGFTRIMNRFVSKGFIIHEDRPHAVVQSHFLAYATELSQSNESTNPLDKVYGLYSILSDNVKDLPQVDYSLSKRQVYTGFTIAMIRSTRNFWPAILLRAMTDNIGSELPSWVPDFGYRQGSHNHDSMQMLANTNIWNATCNSTIHLETLEFSSETTIALRGVIIAMIPAVANTESRPSFEVDPFTGGLLCLWDWLKFVTLLHRSPQHRDWLNDFLEVLIWTDDVRDDVQIQTKISTICVLIPELARLQGNPPSQAMYDEWRADESKSTFFASFYEQVSGSNLFETDTLYLGRTYGAVKEGDALVLIAGSDYPLVFRREEENWRFVGSAYVAGFMNGEAWPKDKDAADMETFILI